MPISKRICKRNIEKVTIVYRRLKQVYWEVILYQVCPGKTSLKRWHLRWDLKHKKEPAMWRLWGRTFHKEEAATQRPQGGERNQHVKETKHNSNRVWEMRKRGGQDYRPLWATVRRFLKSVMGKHWRVLSGRVMWLHFYFKNNHLGYGVKKGLKGDKSGNREIIWTSIIA